MRQRCFAAHNSALGSPLPQPRHIVAVSPGEVPWNDEEKARMKALNETDPAIDYAFMVSVEKFMRHGSENVPDYMISGSRGDFPASGIYILSTARTRCSMVRSRTLPPPVSVQVCRTRSLRDRGWFTATVCCRISVRRRKIFRRSSKYSEENKGEDYASYTFIA